MDGLRQHRHKLTAHVDILHISLVNQHTVGGKGEIQCISQMRYAEREENLGPTPGEISVRACEGAGERMATKAEVKLKSTVSLQS